MSNHFPVLSIENVLLEIPTFISYIKTQLIVNGQFYVHILLRFTVYVPVFMQTASYQFAAELQCVYIKPPVLFFLFKMVLAKWGLFFLSHICIRIVLSRCLKNAIVIKYQVHWDCNSYWMIWKQYWCICSINMGYLYIFVLFKCFIIFMPCLIIFILKDFYFFDEISS